MWLTETKVSISSHIDSKGQALVAFNLLLEKYPIKLPKGNSPDVEWGEVELIDGYFTRMYRSFTMPIVILIAKKGDNEAAYFVMGP